MYVMFMLLIRSTLILKVVLEAEYYLMKTRVMVTGMHQNYVSTIEIERLILLGIPALTQNM